MPAPFLRVPSSTPIWRSSAAGRPASRWRWRWRTRPSVCCCWKAAARIRCQDAGSICRAQNRRFLSRAGWLAPALSGRQHQSLGRLVPAARPESISSSATGCPIPAGRFAQGDRALFPARAGAGRSRALDLRRADRRGPTHSARRCALGEGGVYTSWFQFSKTRQDEHAADAFRRTLWRRSQAHRAI